MAGPIPARCFAALVRDRAVPPGTDPLVLRDFLARRLRNHLLDLAAIELVLDGSLSTLVVGADDTAAAAVGTAEQQWLRRWPGWLDLGDRVLTYPGADEIGAVLIARALLGRLDGPVPTVGIHAVEGLHRVAPYENAPVLQTVLGQIRAAALGPRPGACRQTSSSSSTPGIRRG